MYYTYSRSNASLSSSPDSKRHCLHHGFQPNRYASPKKKDFFEVHLENSCRLLLPCSSYLQYLLPSFAPIKHRIALDSLNFFFSLSSFIFVLESYAVTNNYNTCSPQPHSPQPHCSSEISLQNRHSACAPRVVDFLTACFFFTSFFARFVEIAIFHLFPHEIKRKKPFQISLKYRVCLSE